MGNGQIYDMMRRLCFIGTFFTLAMFSCVEIIDFKTEQKPVVTVFGQITNSSNFGVKVSVQKSITGISSDPVEYLTNAQVFVVNEEGEQTPIGFNQLTGAYERNDYVGTPGNCYQLLVMVDNMVIQSDWSCIPLHNAMTESNFHVERRQVLSVENVLINQRFVRVTQNIQNTTPDDLYLRWDVIEMYFVLKQVVGLGSISTIPCWISTPYLGTSIPLVAFENKQNVVISNFTLADRLIDRTFENVHFFGIVQYSIEREALAYWQKVDALVNRRGSLFEVPPANLSGNIHHMNSETNLDVTGYFEASKVDTSLVAVYRRDVPFILGSGGLSFDLNRCSERIPDFVRPLVD